MIGEYLNRFTAAAGRRRSSAEASVLCALTPAPLKADGLVPGN